MTLPRSTQISLDATPYYHCVSRCARRAFLCGRDAVSGNDYEHRREWIENRILNLAEVFVLNIAAHAVMSNHYHVVLYIDKKSADKWSLLEVITRWQKLFKASRESLNNSVIPLRALKAADVRRSSPRMAVALGKSCNAADAAFKARPSGLAERFTELFRGSLVWLSAILKAIPSTAVS
ncbi:hypothetical protein [Microbulbifer sp. ANSA005]|uniref:hypothetical protein n=1 Tax=Microbulbifer sp. ANSA005 TaxID=3243362 RepID=UPI00404129A1